MYVRTKVTVLEINSVLKKAIRNLYPSMFNRTSKEQTAKIYKEKIENYTENNLNDIALHIETSLTYGIEVFLNLLKTTKITDLSKNKLFAILRKDLNKKTENKEAKTENKESK